MSENTVRQLMWLDVDDEETPFPPLTHALRNPNGLLAAGGALTPRRLETAYRSGIFPWFSEGEPVLWWSPDPRAIFRPGDIALQRSLKKRIRNAGFEVSLDRAFEEVIRACAEPRPNQPSTWIVPEMISAYCEMHRLGLAHSVEVWRQGRLVGGLYGVAFGRGFYGESMFSREADASKVALVWLAGQLWRWGFRFIDCQLPSPHLARLGARLIRRADFARMVADANELPDLRGPWSFDPDYGPLAAVVNDTI